MKTSKIIAGMLVVLGFSSCEPEDDYVPWRCDPNAPRLMYGAYPCEYESKAAVPRWVDPSETVEFPAIPNDGDESPELQ